MNIPIDTHQETSLPNQPSKNPSPSPAEAVPISILPPELEAKLAQVRTIALVDEVYCSPDQETVVVELWRNESLGLKFRNILFFPVEGFAASKVYEAIARLRKPSQSEEWVESSFWQKGR